ncbi:fimbria/pilus outer membrane usher protein [Erwinia sp. E_sp_B01_3]|uniref:fimbria/pilus outer membrane usher protein n=1 Tax=unclassified Erwinia TaxID=2622719 RepID=UPI0030D37C95
MKKMAINERIKSWNSFLVILILPAINFGLVAQQVQAAETFNPVFLESGQEGASIADLSVFENSQSQAPGNYLVDIWLNYRFIESRNVTFLASKDPEDNTGLAPCLKLETLRAYGIRIKAFPNLTENNGCVDITVIPQATATFNFNTQRLLLSIPQAAMLASARGYVSPDKFDEGITALSLNYRFSGANNSARSRTGTTSDSQYLNLRPGFNIGPWRMRNYTTWNRSSTDADKGKWSTVYTRLQRNIVPMKSQLTVGEGTSPAEIFESVPFTGAQLASDEEMLPESLRGYAPVVRGTARTNAQIIVRQNGYIIYQSYVAPGAFEIDDLYATGGSGDMYVTVKEADGSEQHLVVPYASLPVLVREGHLKYSLTSGHYRPFDNAVVKKSFSQATAIYGLPWNLTLYGGVQAAADYQSLALGVGRNLGNFGAFSADILNSWATAKDAVKAEGQSFRVRYSKNFYETGTNFAIAGYRYSTRDYYSLSELMETYRFNENPAVREQARNRTELTVNQNLGEVAGSLSVSLLREDYWRTNRRMESLALGYNNSYKSINYGVSYSYNRNSSPLYGPTRYSKDQLVSFNVSVPLDHWLSNTWASYTVTNSKPGNSSQSVGLSGTSLENNNLYWNAREGYGSQGVGNSGNLDGGYRGTYGEISAGYGYDRESKRVNYGVEGGVIIHKDGATLSQAFGDTAALVMAPGASGVQITNQTGVKTDFRGYTVVPDVTPYRQSDIMLDTTSLPEDVDLGLASQSVVPTRGAIVRATFSAQVGARSIMTLTHNGRPVPFGAIVVDNSKNNKQSYIVGDAGQVYLSGLQPEGRLLVQWGKTANRQCQVDYILPKQKAGAGINILTHECQ